MSVTITLAGSTDPLKHAVIDDEKIAEYILQLLSETRNTMVGHMGGGGHSAPGEYPHTQSGRLASSFHYEMIGAREGEITTEVGYAGFLVGGTRKMAPRKMLHEALMEVMSSAASPDFADIVHWE